MTEIQTEVCPIGELFHSDLITDGVQSGRLLIPPIQRQYQWGPGDRKDAKKNRSAYQFLEDTLNFHQLNQNNDLPYFIGTMILYRDENDEVGSYQLMDGQQRWTTITALMGAIFHILDGDQIEDRTDLKNEISDLFLITDEPDRPYGGRARLESHRGYDDYTIQQLCWFGGEVPTEALCPSSTEQDFDPAPPTIRYSPEGVNGIYTGTNLSCVAQYFLDRLKSNFGIIGPLDPRDNLANFYTTIRDRLFINLTMAPNSSVAYKMFITANGRGTPLNNFDIFRGLVITRERDLELGRSTEYRRILDRGRTHLDHFCATKPTSDPNRLIDSVMSQLTGVLEAQRIESNNVMMWMERRIGDCQDHQSLNSLVEFVVGYATIRHHLTSRPIPFPGVMPHDRLQYCDFSGYLPMYITAIYRWINFQDMDDEGEEALEHLMRIIECFVMRVALCTTPRNATLGLYGTVSQQANQILHHGITEETIRAISEQYEAHEYMPENLTILSNQAFKFADNAAGNTLLCSVFYALESMQASPYRSGAGSANVRKVTPLMPRFSPYAYNLIQIWNYGGERNNLANFSKTIGNFFLLSGTRGDIREITQLDIAERIRRFSNRSAGMNITAAPHLDITHNWTYVNIEDRNDALISLLEERFPHDCWLPENE